MPVPTIVIGGTNGMRGADAYPGQPGKSGTAAVQGIAVPFQPACLNQVRPTDGSPGGAAMAGENGADGSITPTMVIHLGNISGAVRVEVSGGAGGDGGNGARGGDGGNGGAGAAALPGNNPCHAIPPGTGGNGGDGSAGGNGGNGADGPCVTLYYSQMAAGTTFTLNSPPQPGGAGGASGNGGAPGSGSGGNAGRPGAFGRRGATGRAGHLLVRQETAAT